MQQLEATMRHLEDCVRDAFGTLPPGISWDNVPHVPTAQTVLGLKSDHHIPPSPARTIIDDGLAKEFRTGRFFGRASFGFNLGAGRDFSTDIPCLTDSQKDVVGLMRSIRERLKRGQFTDIKITKKFEGFTSKSGTYRKLYMKVSFYGTISTPFQFSMEWAASIPPRASK